MRELPSEKRSLKITERAKRKAETYARLVVETRGDYECLGFLLGDPQSDLVDEVLLAPGQRVTGTSAIVDGPGVLEAGREIERMGKRAKGWFHSHALMPTFHSGVDDVNTEEILGQIAPGNLLYLEEDLVPSITEDGRTFFKDGPETLELYLADEGKPEESIASSLKLRRKVPLGFAYSLVVNARGDAPHAELYTKRWCPHCGSEEIERRSVEIEVIPDIDEARMRDEIKARVFPHTFPPTHREGRPIKRASGDSWQHRLSLGVLLVLAGLFLSWARMVLGQ